MMRIIAILFLLLLVGCKSIEYVEIPAPYPVEVEVIVVVPDTSYFALMRAYVENEENRFDPIVYDSTGIRIIASGTAHEKAIVLVNELVYLHTTLDDLIAWFRQRVTGSDSQ